MWRRAVWILRRGCGANCGRPGAKGGSPGRSVGSSGRSIAGTPPERRRSGQEHRRGSRRSRQADENTAAEPRIAATARGSNQGSCRGGGARLARTANATASVPSSIGIRSRKQPLGMAVHLPPRAQLLQQLGRQRHQPPGKRPEMQEMLLLLSWTAKRPGANRKNRYNRKPGDESLPNHRGAV